MWWYLVRGQFIPTSGLRESCHDDDESHLIPHNPAQSQLPTSYRCRWFTVSWPRVFQKAGDLRCPDRPTDRQSACRRCPSTSPRPSRTAPASRWSRCCSFLRRSCSTHSTRGWSVTSPRTARDARTQAAPVSCCRSVHTRTLAAPASCCRSVHTRTLAAPASCCRSVHTRTLAALASCCRSVHTRTLAAPASCCQSVHIRTLAAPASCCRSVHIRTPTAPASCCRSLYTRRGTAAHKRRNLEYSCWEPIQLWTSWKLELWT